VIARSEWTRASRGALFAGEAKQNEFEVDGRRLIAHQGSAIYFVSYPYSFIGRATSKATAAA
jgi:hypothetical protein